MKCISYCDARERIDPLLPHSALSGYNSWSSRDQTAVESEPLKWKNCLQDLLRHQHGQEAFAKFLKSEYSGENLTFWLHTRRYRCAPGIPLPKPRFSGLLYYIKSHVNE